MSCYNCKKLNITEDERRNILGKYGILNEDVQYLNPSNMLVKSKALFANGKWKNLSPDGDAEFKRDLESTKAFLQKWQGKGYIVRVGIEASESQVTNYDREVEPKVFLNKGVLSQRRADTMKRLLTNVFNQYIEQGLIKEMPIFDPPEVIIGKTSYKRGIDSPTDPKYTPERYVSYMMRATAPFEPMKRIEPKFEPTTPAPMPRVEIPGDKIPPPATTPPFTGTGITEKCLLNLGIQIVYYNTPRRHFARNIKTIRDGYEISKGCCGHHRCNKANYDVLLNGIKIGEANLDNSPGGGDKLSDILTVSEDLTKQILQTDNNVLLSLMCKYDGCHSDAPGYRIVDVKTNNILSEGCVPVVVKTKIGTPRGKYIPGKIDLLYIENCGRSIRKVPGNDIVIE